MTAGSIFEWAKESGCCRIVFFIDSKYVVCEPVLTDVESIFNSYSFHLSTAKVKLQSILNGKFTDVVRYEKVVDSKLLTKALNKHVSDFCALEFMPLFQECLKYGCINELRSFYVKSMYKHIRALHQNVKDNLKLSEFISSIETLEKNNFPDDFCFYICYLKIFNSMERLIREAESTNELFDFIKEFAETELDRYDGNGKQAAISLILGSVASTYNRKLAKDLFDEASLLSSDLINIFGLDVGLFTYFDDNDDLKNEDALTTAVESISISNNTPKNRMALCFSVDERFLKGYGPWIVFYAKHFKDYDFHLLVVNPGKPTIKNLENFLEGLDYLTGDTTGNLYISTIDSPSYCCNDITLSACARFILAKKIISDYSSVYIMDADLSWHDTPESFFTKISTFDIAINKTNNQIAYLSPWRRYLAGNFHITKAAENILDDIVMYILYGLSVKNSWMLDQNAICFALENNSRNRFAFINDFDRPFTQDNLRNVIEKNIKAW